MALRQGSKRSSCLAYLMKRGEVSRAGNVFSALLITVLRRLEITVKHHEARVLQPPPLRTSKGNNHLKLSAAFTSRLPRRCQPS